MSLQSIAQQYHSKADRLVLKHTDEDGKFDAAIQPTVDYYRDTAAAVLRLQPEEVEGDSATWNLEGDVAPAINPKSGVTTRDKAATPQELLAKANG
jgi:hypothetical protein